MIENLYLAYLLNYKNPFKWHKNRLPCNLDRDLCTKKSLFGLCCHKGIHVSQTQIRNRIRGHLVFSTPEPKAQVHYCDQALSVRPSVVVNFSHFQLLLWNHWTEFNEIWQEAKSQSPPPGLCFLGRSEKQDSRSGLWLAETFSTPPLKPLNGIQRNLTGSKISTSSTKFVFFGQIGKTRWPPWPLVDWVIFYFFSETVEWNSTKLCRMEFNETWQEARSHYPLRSFCFSGRSEKQVGRPGLWWAESCSTSPLKPPNEIQRNLTGSKISTSSGCKTQYNFRDVFGPEVASLIAS